MPYLNESTRLAEEEVASLATIEEVGRSLFGTTLGPFELMNVTGIPIAFHSETSLSASFGAAYGPSSLLESQFRSGKPWAWKESEVEADRKGAVRDRLLGLVFGISTELVEEGVATAEATDRGATVGLRWGQGPFQLLNQIGLSEGARLVEEYAERWKGAFPVSPNLLARARQGETSWPLSYVRLERRGTVHWVLLDRPEVLNSLNSTVLSDLQRTFEGLSQDSSVRCVVLSGSSPVFAAGADIAEMERKNLSDGLGVRVHRPVGLPGDRTVPDPGDRVRRGVCPRRRPRARLGVRLHRRRRRGEARLRRRR